MKITVWIRPANEGRDITLRVDPVWERDDTPTIQRYGQKLVAAIESGGERVEE